MDKVSNYNCILNEISLIRSFKKGYITNFYQDEKTSSLWIKYNMLFCLSFEECFFLFKDNGAFTNFYYCATGIESLSKSLFQLRNKQLKSKFVVDIIGDLKSIELQSSLFMKYGYEQYTDLFRMSRIIDQVERDKNPCVGYAYPNDAPLIANLLNNYFDPLCEQLPLLDEIQNWIEQKHLLVIKDGSFVVGFLAFDLIGKTSYLRYWFTHPDYRDKKIGSLLLHNFFAESKDCKRQLFWVLRDNKNAIMRYEHYGFKAELIHDRVLISK